MREEGGWWCEARREEGGRGAGRGDGGEGFKQGVEKSRWAAIVPSAARALQIRWQLHAGNDPFADQYEQHHPGGGDSERGGRGKEKEESGQGREARRLTDGGGAGRGGGGHGPCDTARLNGRGGGERRGPRCGCRGGRERRREAETGDTREAEGGGGAALMWVISYEINGAWYERGMQFSAEQHLLTGAGCSSIHDLM